MGKLLIVVVIGIFSLSACATSGLKQQCQERQKNAARVAALAESKLHEGLSVREVRTLLGEPDEALATAGENGINIWRYGVLPDCRNHLGISAPTTELYFGKGFLLRWATYEK
jgi:hypothetical protein